MVHYYCKAQLFRHRRLFRFLFAAAALSLSPFYALSQYGDYSSRPYGSRTPSVIDHRYSRRQTSIHSNQPASSCDNLFGLDSRKTHERRWILGDKILTRPCIVHGSLLRDLCLRSWHYRYRSIQNIRIGIWKRDRHGCFRSVREKRSSLHTRRMLFCCLTIVLSQKTHCPLMQSQALPVTFVLQARDNYLLLPLWQANF